jgi:hypothetical protein
VGLFQEQALYAREASKFKYLYIRKNSSQCFASRDSLVSTLMMLTEIGLETVSLSQLNSSYFENEYLSTFGSELTPFYCCCQVEILIATNVLRTPK